MRGIDAGRRRLLSPAVLAARDQIQNPRLLSDRIAMGRALWRDLVVGFAAQIADARPGLLPARGALRRGWHRDVDDRGSGRADRPLAVGDPRLVAALEERGLLKRTEEVADRRQRTLEVTPEGKSVLGRDRHGARGPVPAVVRPLPPSERALVAMGVAALSTRAMTRRGRLIKAR